jgi:RNA polymerase sigma factor (sigma-70 family)
MATAALVTPISPDCTDEELVAAIRRGSDAAFEELYSRYSGRIGSYVRGMVSDHGRAEDITQEIFIAALRRMRDTERPISFKPWIYEIAKNACIDSFRRTRRAQEISLDTDEGLSSADRGRLTVVTTPDAALDSKQAIQNLRGAFGSLSDSHHEILVLRELEGRSYNDIGERLGMSRPVVESTLFRARRRLAEEYDELTSGRRCEFVHKMVDSGPHYSLGIRDRRRIARHLAHCQSCRAHARSAGFDESILNMPSVAARIAAVLPVPILRGRFSPFDGLGVHRGRPSILVRSVHTLASSADQILGAGPGAGRGAAAAAAIVLAGVGGGLVTNSAYQRGHPLHPRGLHARAHAPHARATARAAGGAPGAVPRSSLRAAKSTVSSGAAPVARHAGSRSTTVKPVVVSGTARGSGAQVPSVTTPGAAAPPSPPPATATGHGAPAAPSSGSGVPPGDGAGVAAGPAMPVVPVVSLPTGTPPAGPVSTALGGLTDPPPQVPAPAGSGAGSTQPGSVTGTVGGVIAGVGQLIGGS